MKITRDEYAPEFVGAPYTAPSLPENKRVGEQVFQVKGRDRDQKGQLKYALIGDPPSPNYFTVNTDSGVITIRQDLRRDYSPYYIVSALRPILASIIVWSQLHVHRSLFFLKMGAKTVKLTDSY